MLKIAKHIALASVLILAASCASDVKKQVSAADKNAPSWYESRKAEVLEKGYPDFKSVPEPKSGPVVSPEIVAADISLEKEIQELESDPKAMTALEEGREDPRIWAKKVRDEIEEGLKSD